jgi:D-galactarolactone cycloisomerase
MRIKRIETHVLRVALSNGEAFAYSQSWYDCRTAMIVEIECDDGTTGCGEAFGPPFVNAATIETVYKPMLLGRDPLDRDTLWLEMYNKLRDHGRKGSVIEALSAVDIALWDIAGKHFGVPVYRLLGRHYRDRVEAYATGLYRKRTADNTAALVDEARTYAGQGFRAMKIKIGFGPAYDLEITRAIREALGPGIRLAVDANHAYDVSTALRLCDSLEPLGIEWFEEPIVPEELEGFRQLRARTSIPISTGEAEFTRWGFRDLIAAKVVDIVQPDCCVVGGLTEALRVADLADAWHVRCVPHVWGTGVAIAVALQLLAMIPPCPPSLYPIEPMLELDRTANVFREELNRNGYDLSAGVVKIPDLPGLGVDLDRKVLEKYRIRA